MKWMNKDLFYKEFLFMVVSNFIIIMLSVMICRPDLSIEIEQIDCVEQEQIECNETNTYVQYIERSDKEKYLPIADTIVDTTADITEEVYNTMPDQSLSEDTSDIDVTVTDSCQKFLELTENEVYLLAKINECEAGNQNIETRMLIVLTVLNRVKSDKFPDTIEEVIKQNHNGVYQFSPLRKGGSWYYTEPSDDAYKAVDLVTEELLNGIDTSDGSLYFESCKDEDNWHSRNLEFLYQSEDTRFYK